MITRQFSEEEFVATTNFIHEGVQIALEAKQLAPGSKLQDFIKFIGSQDFPLTQRITDLQTKVEALTSQFPLPGVQ